MRQAVKTKKSQHTATAIGFQRATPFEAHINLPNLTIVLPALNEEATIESVISKIPSQLPHIGEINIIVVDDGSTDNTANLAFKSGATVITHHNNLGVGAAFQSGLKAALQKGADIIVNIDSDGQFDPRDIPTLIKPIQDNKAEFVTATRFAKKNLIPSMPIIKRLGNQGMVWIVNFITKRKFTDVSCGFRGYTREAALRLTLFGHFTYTQETLIDLAFKNVATAEVPLRVQGERSHGKSRVASNLWKYALKSATIIFRAARDYRPHYFIGAPGLIVLGAGIFSGLFLVRHYITSNFHITPYRSLVQLSGVLIIVGVLMLFLSMLADMMHRNRIIVEESVYHARKMAYSKRQD